MVGQASINGQDLWSTWKARLQRGTIGALLESPTMKPYTTNTSRLIDGVEIDVSNPRVEARELELHIVIRGTTQTEYINNILSFESTLKSGPLRLVYSAIPNTVFNIVYTSPGGQFGRYGRNAGKFVYRFLEPNPANRV